MRLGYADEEIILSRILANSNEKKEKNQPRYVSISISIDIAYYFPNELSVRISNN